MSKPADNALVKPVAVGVGGIVVRDRKVLLIRRYRTHGAGEWSTPGGYLDFGESPEQCAGREVQEETGVEAGPFQFAALTNDVLDTKHFITIWMTGPWIRHEPRMCAPDEIDATGWFDLTDLPSPLFAPFQRLLRGDCYRAHESASLRDVLAMSQR